MGHSAPLMGLVMREPPGSFYTLELYSVLRKKRKLPFGFKHTRSHHKLSQFKICKSQRRFYVRGRSENGPTETWALITTVCKPCFIFNFLPFPMCVYMLLHVCECVCVEIHVEGYSRRCSCLQRSEVDLGKESLSTIHSLSSLNQGLSIKR